MRLSVFAIAATAFACVQAGQTIGITVDFKYVNPDRTETNPRFASGLIVSLANSNINKAFNPSPKFDEDDSTTAAATPTVDMTELVEGDYSFVILEDGPSGSIFEKDFVVTLRFAA